jgi:hypothetical protein
VHFLSISRGLYKFDEAMELTVPIKSTAHLNYNAGVSLFFYFVLLFIYKKKKAF